MDFLCADLLPYIQHSSQTFDHIDSHGVLHHSPYAKELINLFSRRLSPGGTIRIMVYNSSARTWIRSLQRLFKRLDLSPFHPKDIAAAKKTLMLLKERSPGIAEKLNFIPNHTFDNRARFVDTFMHVQERNISVHTWFQWVREAELEVYAMTDRLAELDDLKPTLFTRPDEDAIHARCSDKRMEDNLVLFLHKPEQRIAIGSSPSPRLHLGVKSSPPPRPWFQFDETRELSRETRVMLWTVFLGALQNKFQRLDPNTYQLRKNTLQRLARLGAIFPHNLHPNLQSEIFEHKMAKKISPPKRIETCSIGKNEIREMLHRLNLGRRLTLSEKFLIEVEDLINQAESS